MSSAGVGRGRSGRLRWPLALVALSGCFPIGAIPAGLEAHLAATPPASSPTATASPSASPPATHSPYIETNDLKIGSIPFSSGPDEILTLFDPALHDVVPIFGAGPGVENPTLFDDNRRIAFDQHGRIWAWDRWLEEKVMLQNVDAIPDVADPGFDASASLMVFHNPTGVYLWTRHLEPATAASTNVAIKPPSPPPSLDPFMDLRLQGEVVELAKIHAVALADGGIADAEVDSAGRLIAFLTGDGRLWTYFIPTADLELLPEVNRVGTGHVDSMALNPADTNIAFGSGPQLYLDQLSTHGIDPMPYANTALGGVSAQNPIWIDSREFYYQIVQSDGQTLLARYNWLTETVRAAFYFNNVLGLGILSNRL